MTPPLTDLLVLTGATYGWAWIITQSSLLSGARLSVAKVPVVGKLVQCIACTGAWVGLELWWWAGLVARGHDIALSLGWSVFACWALGRLLGDAD